LAEPADSRILRAKNRVGSGPAVEFSGILGVAEIGIRITLFFD